jgi:hypothetical protein
MSKAAASVWSACIKALDALVKTKPGAPAYPAAFSRANAAMGNLKDRLSCTAKEWRVLVQELKVKAGGSVPSNHTVSASTHN